jgi:hypothetical protein
MRQRPDITNARVKELFKKHKNKSHVAAILDCSHRLVSDALDGSRKDPEDQGGKRKPRRLRKTENVKKCSCCKTAPIKKGNRFLCRNCEDKTFGFEEHICIIPNNIKGAE